MSALQKGHNRSNAWLPTSFVRLATLCGIFPTALLVSHENQIIFILALVYKYLSMQRLTASLCILGSFAPFFCSSSIGFIMKSLMLWRLKYQITYKQG